jgi:hypothetical protein
VEHDAFTWLSTDAARAMMLQPLSVLTALAVHGRTAGVMARDPSHLARMPLLRSLALQHAQVEVGLSAEHSHTWHSSVLH